MWIKKRLRLFFICSSIVLLGSNAESSVLLDGIPVFISPYVSVGYASLNASGVIPGANAPALSFYTGGVTAGYSFAEIVLVGLSSDFSFINQYSNPINNGGNYRGTRWNIVSPSLGLQLADFTFIADVEFLGSYNLANSDVNGNSVSFSGPLGGKFRALYSIFSPINLGVQFEYLTFNTMVNSGTGNQTLSPSLILWQGGLIASYVF